MLGLHMCGAELPRVLQSPWRPPSPSVNLGAVCLGLVVRMALSAERLRCEVFLPQGSGSEALPWAAIHSAPL